MKRISAKTHYKLALAAFKTKSFKETEYIKHMLMAKSLKYPAALEHQICAKQTHKIMMTLNSDPELKKLRNEFKKLAM